MCKLLVITKKEGDNPVLRKLLESQASDLKQETDGISLLGITKNKKVFTERNLTNYKSVLDEADKRLSDCVFLSLHSRTGTSGKDTIENVHFWKHKNRYFAHNGFVSKFHTYAYENTCGFNKDYSIYEGYNSNYGYSQAELQGFDLGDPDCKGCLTAKKGICRTHLRGLKKPTDSVYSNDKCDSLQYLENLPKNLSVDIIGEFNKATNFSGMSVIIDEKPKLRLWLTIAKEAYVSFDNEKSFNMFSSYKPEVSYQNIIINQANDVRYVEKHEKINLPVFIYPLMQSVYKMNIPELSKNKKHE